MSLTPPETTAAAPSVATRHLRTARWGELYVVVFVLVLFLVPATVVLPGPLNSFGSPAVLMTLVGGGLVSVCFLTGRFGPGLANAGTVTLLVAAVLLLITWVGGQRQTLSPDVQAATTRGILSVVSSTAIALAVMIGCRASRQRLNVIAVAVAAMAYSGVVGVLQARLAIDGRYWLQPPGFVLNRDFSFEDRAGFDRAFGTAESPIEFSVYMSCLLAMSIVLIRSSGDRRIRALGVVGLLIAPLATLDSLSRTGVLTTITVAVVFVASLSIPVMVPTILFGAAAIALIFVLDPSRFNEVADLFKNAGSDNSVTGRTDDYTPVFETFRRHPVIGLGLGTQLPSSTRFLDNQWLYAALGGGVVGVVATALQFMAGIAGTRGPYPSDAHRAEAVGYLSVIGAMVVSSFTFDLYAFNQAKFLMFVTIGLAWSLRVESRSVVSAFERPAAP